MTVLRPFLCGAVTLAIVMWCSASVGATFLQPCGATPYSILLHVEDVKNDKGSVTIALYDDEPERFLKKGEKLGHLRVPATTGITSACIAAPHAGDYAIAVYHDEDGNGKVTKSWIGIPQEGFGFSNNPSVFLAPPKHSEAVVFVQEGQTVLNIKIQY
jgi:uncharacterized protein (DUF2141 family)